MKIRVFAALAALLLCVSLGGCQSSSPSSAPTGTFSREGFALDTTVSVTLYDGGSEALLDACFALIGSLEKEFSRTSKDGDIASLNAAPTMNAVMMPTITTDMLKQALDVSAKSGGAFDITVGAYIQLWGFGTENAAVPSDLSSVAAAVGYDKLTVGKDAAMKMADNMVIDLGGVAKGYIADWLGDTLRQSGIKSALLDLGGNILAVGDKNGQPFRIGIRDIDGEGLAGIVSVRDQAVVTSGVYERFFTQDGIDYHHVLDPRTGYPAGFIPEEKRYDPNSSASVTICCKDAALADMLSTACLVMPREEAIAMLNEHFSDVGAVFISRSGEIVTHRITLEPAD